MLTWMGAGVLAAGVCTASLTGAAVAAAEDDSGTGATESSQSSQTSGAAADTTARASAKPPPRAAGADPDEKPASPEIAGDTTDDDTTDDDTADNDAADGDTADDAADRDGKDDDSADPDADSRDPVLDDDTGIADSADPPAAAQKTAVPAPEDAQPVAVGAVTPADSEAIPTAPASPADSVTQPASATEKTSTTAQLATPSADEPVSRPSLLNVVGSFFWGLFDALTKFVDVPPALPPGSALAAGRSKLDIDCGDGYTADADWYFPAEGAPDKLLYFQHGFPARAGFYNVTLAQLAERNNAIVVAPSITSNIFACDACAASGEPMQAAVARLFEGDRAALLASAVAAGYQGALPERFVFTGQSAGASLAVAAAGYYHQNAMQDEKSDMVGVLLYEVSPIGSAVEGNALSNALEKLPSSVPVLNIAAEPNMLNSKGGANAIFVEKRPGQFNGVQLSGGAHSDAFRSDVLFGIPQLIVSVFFGASDPTNVEAVQVLTTGWLTDMYAGRVYDPQSRTGIYGNPGEPGEVVVDIPTVAGMARGYVLPARTPAPSFFDRLLDGVYGLINVNLFARCVDGHETADTATGQSCAVDAR